MENRARALLQDMFRAAVAAADPALCLAAHLPEKPKGRCVVVGAGKAAAAMAAALESAWPDVELSGTVVTTYGLPPRTLRIKILEAGHPVPDAGSESAARQILSDVRDLTADDLVIALISGGGSSLMALPAPWISLVDKQAATKALLASGATIAEINVVRKHLSAVKGGRLAKAALPARVVTLAISDVPGDDPATIASGPTVPDPSTWADVDRICKQHGIFLPVGIIRQETPKPGEFDLDYRVIATPAMALRAAAEVARAAGVTPLILGDAIEGEAREMGTVMAGIARSVRTQGLPCAAPCVLISGGEATVTMHGEQHGKGGPNQEFALAAALALRGLPDVWLLAGDTDGIDGNNAAAGALLGPDFLQREGIFEPEVALRLHDVTRVLAEREALLTTGQTQTNVNDFRAVLVL